MIEEMKTNGKKVTDAAAQAGAPWVAGLRKLPLASLGLAATIGDETKTFFVDQLVMNKLVARGESVQKDVDQWMQDVQARFR